MQHNRKKGFTLVEIAIVVVIIGILSAMSLPFFEKIRTISQVKAITNNLRQLSHGAERVFLEHGLTEVSVEDLVGPDKYVKTLTPVAGEVYPELIVEGTDIVVTTAAGLIVSVDF